MTGEYDGDGSASTKGDGGVEVGKNWGCHGREVILNINHQQGTCLWIWVSFPNLVLLI